MVRIDKLNACMILGLPFVEDKIFTPHGFISLATRTTSTYYEFWEIYFKVQKSPYLNKMTPKPTIQNPWQYYLIKAHCSSS